MQRTFYALLLLLLLLSGCAPSLQAPENGSSTGKPDPQQKSDIAGIDFTQLSRSEVERQLAELEAQTFAKPISLNYGAQRFTCKWSDLGVSSNKAQVLDSAYATYPNPTHPQLELEFKLNTAKAAKVVARLTAALNTPSKDAALKAMTDKTTQVIPHQLGKKVDLQQTVTNLQQALKTGAGEVDLRVRDLYPKITTADLAAISFTQPSATFSTPFAPSDKNRTENLRRSAQALNNSIINPGEVFSFNKVVGSRSEENGYKEALVIEENELVPGIGGGVCQVSSTLYNLALLADLPIVERHPHEFAVRYVPPGRDATVVYDQADLRFKNNTAGPLVLRAQAQDAKLTLNLFGKSSGKKVEIKTTVLATQPFATERRFDPTLPPGTVDKSKAGMPGYVVKTWRIVKLGQKVVREDVLGKDVYKPATRIIRVGPAKGKEGTR
ncbi:MAG: VanW family protein [Peptococcaceae bacterium]|nr:VanW family protein [Peptococcaceae bacterium]